MNYRTTYDPAEPEKIKETTIQNLMGASNKKKDKDKKDDVHEGVSLVTSLFTSSLLPKTDCKLV